MIVYLETKEKFHDDVATNKIDEIVLAKIKEKLHIGVSPSEKRSWQQSIQYMNTLLMNTAIPNDSGIAIEFRIPASSKRIDFMITGYDNYDKYCAIIIELKQWETAEVTEKDGIVKTYLAHQVMEVTHPSYQAWSYKQLLEDFNEAVSINSIDLVACC